MNKSDATRSEELNAYLDGELTHEQRTRLRQRLNTDPRLRRHSEELDQIRSLTRAAFQVEMAESGSAPQASRRQALRYALAAMLLVALGMGLQFWLHPAPPTDDFLATLPADARVIRPAVASRTAAKGEQRVIFHVSSADPKHFRTTMDQVQALLERYRSTGIPLRLEIVANAEGLNLLRADTTPVREQITRLHQQYSNVAFIACGNTMARYKHERGKDANLLPQATITASALDQILLRLNQGWTYVHL